MFDVASSHLFAVERVIGLATDPQTGSFRLYQNSKPVIATFDVAHASSDGEVLLLKPIDGQLGLTAALAGGILDRRPVSRKVWGRGVIASLRELRQDPEITALRVHSRMPHALQGSVVRLVACLPDSLRSWPTGAGLPPTPSRVRHPG